MTQPASNDRMALDLTAGSLDISGFLDVEGKKFQCENCSYTTNVKCNFQRHSKRHSKQLPKDSPLLIPATSTPLKSCDDKKQNFICDQCAKVFKSKFGLSLHKKNKHEHTFKYKCEICSKGFNQTIQYKFHCANHVNLSFTKCVHCLKTFKGHSSLKRHTTLCSLNPDISKSATVEEFSCPECGKSFPTKDRLNYHLKGKHGAQNYICEKCGKRYSWRSSLKEHKKRCNIFI